MGKLTLEFVDTVKEPGRHPDGDGLSLRVRKSGSKQWIWRGTIRGQGKRPELGLGGYPSTSLAGARREAKRYAELAKAGKDPGRRQREAPTFAEGMERVISRRRSTWKKKTEADWRRSLGHVPPRLGTKRIDEITALEIMGVLLPIWSIKTKTARRVLQRIGAIMKWAVAEGYRKDNPVDAVRAKLPKQRILVRKHPDGTWVGVDEDYLDALLERSAKTATSKEDQEQKMLEFMEWSIAKGSRPTRDDVARSRAKQLAKRRDAREWELEIWLSKDSFLAWKTVQELVKYLWERGDWHDLLVHPERADFSPLWTWGWEVAMGVRKEPPKPTGTDPYERLYRNTAIAVTVIEIAKLGLRPIYPRNRYRRSACALVAERLRDIGEGVTTEGSVRDLLRTKGREE